MLDKPNARVRKITSKKVEDEFKKECSELKEFVQKIYIVIVDGKVHRFEKWKEAKELIDRNPGAKYKSFVSENDAQEFANLNIRADTLSEDSLVCRIMKTGEIILEKNENIIEKTFIKNSKNGIEMELQGALAGIRKAISLGEEQVIIEYSNLGTEMWANGT